MLIILTLLHNCFNQSAFDGWLLYQPPIHVCLILPTVASLRHPSFHLPHRGAPLSPSSRQSTHFTWAAICVFLYMTLQNTFQWMFGLTLNFTDLRLVEKIFYVASKWMNDSLPLWKLIAKIVRICNVFVNWFVRFLVKYSQDYFILWI